MEEPKNKYILLNNRVGHTVERNLLALGLSTKSTPTNVLRGELLEALPEAEQPQDSTRIALVGIDRKSLRIECSMDDLTLLTDEDANLLLAISSSDRETRYQTLIDRKRLAFGRQLSPFSQVFVSVKGIPKEVVGVVWYKGELRGISGTMFGIELIKNPGQGTSDGTFRNKRYFECEPDCGVFVGLDKLKPKEDLDPPAKSPKRSENSEGNFKSRLKDTVMPPFLKGKTDHNSAKERCDKVLEIDQRVVTFVGDHPVRGTVRYIGEEKGYASGNVHTIVGLEMDERVGSGTGKRNGRQLIVCKRDHAAFVALETVISEKDFDENPKETTTTAMGTSERQDSLQDQIQKEESLARSMSYDYGTSVNQPSETRLNLQRQLREKEEQLTNFQGQLREKELREVNFQEQLRDQDQQLENAQRQLREKEQQLTGMEQRLTNFQGQLREKELQEVNFHGQLREKDQQLENAQRQLREMEQQLTNFQGQLRGKELQEASLHEQLREKDQQQENVQRQLREMQQQLTNLQGQFRQKEEETTTLEGQLRAKDQEVNELEITLSTAQQTLNDQQRQQSPDWVIPGDQIQLTDKCLGRGGWGSVVEGKYCGCVVAVKQIHELILSPHNLSLFEREMDIASRCRHPCLLQFIGATNDEGSPLFVTELMETSLRALLEQRPLSATEVSIISLDVARALNYLHQKKPSPIIHRDISSANVLLWRQGDQWRGKVSDYGTANFMQQTMTVAPGAMIYSAPDALNSQNQTVKIDVYSFGVLLCEMCIRELPDPGRRDQQVAMVTNRLLRALIRRCLQSEPATRPIMEEIVEELEEPA